VRNLYLIHSDTEHLHCSFNTVIVRNAALAAKYAGGITAFAERHAPRCNNDISVTCHMASDVDLVVDDLLAQSFEHGSDFVFFDAVWPMIGANMTGKYEEMPFGGPWLAGAATPKGVYVWYRNQ
jgi:hypothetical protein